MKNRMPLGLAAVGLGCSVWAAVALAAPANTKPPTIAGKPAIGSVLTCNRGTWSSDAVTFDYSWVGDGGVPTYASSQKWRVNGGLGYTVHCHVVAHDSRGGAVAADSAAVTIVNGISSVRVIKITQKHGTLTVSGVAGPSAALRHKSFDAPRAVLSRRLSRSSQLQLTFGRTKFGRGGRFTLTGRDTPGRHTYIVDFIPAPSSQYAISHASKTITVRR